MIQIIDKTKTFKVSLKSIPLFAYFKFNGYLYMKITPMNKPNISSLFDFNVLKITPGGYDSSRFSYIPYDTEVEPVNVTITVEAQE